MCSTVAILCVVTVTGSTAGEAAVVAKLSDAQLGDSSHSLVSDTSIHDVQDAVPPSTAEQKLVLNYSFLFSLHHPVRS